MTGKCPNCHKDFTILYPQMWAYKRNSDYFCSWKCLRATDKEKGVENGFMEKARMNKDQQKKAVEIALAGGNPLRFLEECGSKNAPAAWYMIKQKVKETDPETYEKLPKRIQRKDSAPPVSLADAMTGMQNAADMFFGACEDAGLRLNAETPEAPKVVTVTKVEAVPEITRPVVYDGMTVREIEGGFGRYRRSDVNGSIYIDFEYTEGADVMSLTVKQWRSFLAEMDNAAKILGVTL